MNIIRAIPSLKYIQCWGVTIKLYSFEKNKYLSTLNMNSKNKICDVLKRKRNVISLKIKLDQIGKSSSMSNSIYVTFFRNILRHKSGNTVNRMPIPFSLKAILYVIAIVLCSAAQVVLPYTLCEISI